MLPVLATRLVQALTLLWLPVHFGLSLLYAFPLNPLKISMEPTLYATIGRFFSQNWSLFAPNPLAENRSLLVRCLNSQELDGVLKGTVPQEQWFDLTKPLVTQHQQHRFSAYDRVARPQQNAIRGYMAAGSGVLDSWARACSRGQKPACAEYDRRVKIARREPTMLLTRVASSFCAEAAPAAVAASLRLRTSGVIPWSHRYASDAPKSKDYELGSYPLLADVARGPDVAAPGAVP